MTTEASTGAVPANASPSEILYPSQDGAAPTAAAAPEPAVGTDGEVAPSATPAPDAEGVQGSLATGGEVEGTKEAAEQKGEGTDDPPPTPLSLDSYGELKLPEGLEVDASLLTKFKETSLAGKVDPAAAQSYLALYNEALQTAQAAQQKAAQDQVAQWVTASNALPEFQGATGRSTREALGRLFDEFGTPELGRFLSSTGVGNQPDLVRYFAKVALALDEGRPAPTGAPGSLGSPNGKPVGPRSPGQILYQSGGPGSNPDLAQ